MDADHAVHAVSATPTAAEKAAGYKLALEKLDDFFAKNEVDTVGRMATVNAVLKLTFPAMWFVGFYTVRGADQLQIGPYQGALLATGQIAFKRGQCGLAAAEQATQIVDDVGTCKNYIACDAETKSEIVVPVFGACGHAEPGAAAARPWEAGGGGAKRLIAVLDIDSDHLAAFDATDKEWLELLCRKYF